MFDILYALDKSGILYLIMILGILFYSFIIITEISKHKFTMRLFKYHLHENVMFFHKEPKAPHLLSVFFGMSLNQVTYRRFFKYAKRYIRNNTCFIMDPSTRDICDIRLVFLKNRNKISFYAIDDSDGSILSRFTVKSGDYCDERFVKWFDTIVTLGINTKEKSNEY